MSRHSSAALAGIPAPSVTGRAVLSVALLIGFYAVTLSIALVLFAIPVLAVMRADSVSNVRGLLFLTGACWVSAGVLVYSVLSVRRPAYRPEGRRLLDTEAPALFALVAELAQRAGTEPPTEIYLTDGVDLAVTQDGDRRILVVGAPILAWATVEELQAGLAHEMGHFAFGDTRLIGLVTHAHAAFLTVLEATKRSAFDDSGFVAVEVGRVLAQGLGNAIVKSYARIFFWLTNPLERRAELAADQLAARLVGPAPIVRLLEKLAVTGTLYDAYMSNEVASVRAMGGIPTDLAAGFAAFCTQMQTGGHQQRLQELIANARTRPYDTHPSLSDRKAALARATTNADPSPTADSTLALTLITFDLESWLVEYLVAHARLESSQSFVKATWAELPTAVMAPAFTARARAAAAGLFAHYPAATTLTAMFREVVRAVGAGQDATIALAMEPNLGVLVGVERARATKAIVSFVLEALFTGALLEQGATIDPALGESAVIFHIDGAAARPILVVRHASQDAGAWNDLVGWSAWLDGRGQAGQSAPPPALLASA